MVCLIMEKPDPLAYEFVRFCQQRCHQGWPEFYDEMCWVAGRRLFRGMGYAELIEHGLSFGLNDIENTIEIMESVTSQDRNTGS